MKKGVTEDDPVRQATIRTKMLNRNVKDYDTYVTELKREKDRLQQFQIQDPDKASQQQKVVEEAAMMIPNSRNRVRATLDDLAAFLKEERVAEALKGTEIDEASQNAIKAAEAVLAQSPDQ